MKYRIDFRYVTLQTLKATAGYLLGLYLVWRFCSLNDYWGFVISSFMAFIVLLFLLVFPRNISVNENSVSFVKEKGILRTVINIKDITSIMDESNSLFNTISIITKRGIFKLHPADKSKFIEAISL